MTQVQTLRVAPQLCFQTALAEIVNHTVCFLAPVSYKKLKQGCDNMFMRLVLYRIATQRFVQAR
uniref:Uncharacterized protein n=1 Tax=Anguilla anguilla TaxID=7936 RepID=A0A0E9UFJ2_ANGAN